MHFLHSSLQSLHVEIGVTRPIYAALHNKLALGGGEGIIP